MRYGSFPTGRQDIATILYSGFFRDLPPRGKQALISAFGGYVFYRLRGAEDKSREITGLDEQGFRKVISGFIRMQRSWDDVEFLQGNGLGLRQALHVCNSMGAGVKEKLRDKPYMTVRLRLLTFSEIDDFARAVGIGAHDPERLIFGAEHVLNTMADQGHTAVPIEMLESKLQRDLGISRGQILPALDCASNDGQLVLLADQDRVLVGLEELVSAEQRCAAALIAMAPLGSSDKTHGLMPLASLSSEQNQAVFNAILHKVTVITGGPGTGKTHTLKGLIGAAMKAGNKKILLAAPTGKAADRMRAATGVDADTLHKALDFKPGEGFRKCAASPLDADLIVVDEASMVDARIFDALLQAIPKGASLVLIGDDDQLPSVGPGSVLRDLIASTAFPVTRLTVDRRFAGDIAITAQAINAGAMPEFSDDSDCRFIQTASDEQTVSVVLKLASKEIAERHGIPPERVQVLSPRRETVTGVENINEQLKALVNHGHGKEKIQVARGTFHEGDRIMQLTNDYQLGLNNGQVGTIESIQPGGRYAQVKFEGSVVNLPKKAFRNVALAYAATVHKSQGSEYDAVIIPVASSAQHMLYPRLLYTAVTRAKKAVYFVGDKDVLARGLGRDSSSSYRHTVLQGALAPLAAPKKDLTSPSPHAHSEASPRGAVNSAVATNKNDPAIVTRGRTTPFPAAAAKRRAPFPSPAAAATQEIPQKRISPEFPDAKVERLPSGRPAPRARLHAERIASTTMPSPRVEICAEKPAKPRKSPKFPSPNIMSPGNDK